MPRKSLAYLGFGIGTASVPTSGGTQTCPDRSLTWDLDDPDCGFGRRWRGG
jgi:hypothetical protein